MKGSEQWAKPKPAGGYRLIKARALLAVWTSYAMGTITLRDLRVWLACQEMIARRCLMDGGRRAHYTLAELHTLVGGVGGMHLRKSIKRLERASLLRWSDEALSCAVADAAEPARLVEMLSGVQNHRRNVPVPRRMLRHLAQSGKRVLIATAFGHLLRCLYFRAGQCRPEGLCKASWVASVFGVDVRNVKSARRELIDLGWLVTSSCPQRVLNRFGSRVRINLEWGDDTSDSPLPEPCFTTELPPPISNRELSSKSKNQKPARRGPSGVWQENLKCPSLRHVVPEDLRDGSRLRALHAQAVDLGLIGRSEHERLQFFAAAEHSRAIARSNPCGLFASLVRKREWRFITLDDEARAKAIMRDDNTKRKTQNARSGPQRAVPPTQLTRLGDLLPETLRGALALPPGCGGPNDRKRS